MMVSLKVAIEFLYNDGRDDLVKYNEEITRFLIRWLS